ncbi:hypothetical protein Halha_0038 [Halobacteroides halobius DSM 5150]|uniref:Uncharacterized protein n=1 Tax=Halobacteroides halobius (strain ATCC 35273 / DSM 5150 / MD-1) TaxID=748449 RepID=L0K6S0_HALHC|nr:hypothetical protein [Halobacteroides halobius]AGB40064.1 hypothetical protein Halha_0038 [Halobacteroides halobius DSM 5150]
MDINDDFKLRIDVTFSNKNMPNEALSWLKDKYYNHAGSKTEFIRKLIISLYKSEQKVNKNTNQEIKHEKKQDLKEEVLGYVIKNLKEDDFEIKEDKKEDQLIKDVSKEQARTQDIILDQLNNL